MSPPTPPAESITARGSLRLALGTVIALPTTAAFLALSVAVVLGRSVAALGLSRLARVGTGARR
jgi:hypothetical protein